MPGRKDGKMWYVSLSSTSHCLAHSLLFIQFAVLSYTNKNLCIYEREEDLGTKASPLVSVLV